MYTGIGISKILDGKYIGQFENGLRQGHGTMLFNNCDRYDGEWVQGKMHGLGEYLFYDVKEDEFTQSYKGMFCKGVREGHGKMVYSNHDFYIGTWQNDHRTGEGICWFSNGDVFHGIWKFDHMVRGVMKKANGDIYDGEIKNGTYHGYGKIFYKNGKWFEGIFDHNKPLKGHLYSMKANDIIEIIEGKSKE